MIVHAINVCDGNLGELFFRDAFETANIDAVHLANGSVVPDAEWPHATDLAEEVLILSCIEQVFSEHLGPGKQPELFWCCDRRPKPISSADGAVAAIGALNKV